MARSLLFEWDRRLVPRDDASSLFIRRASWRPRCWRIARAGS